MESALKGLRVIDLSRALAGPYGSMILADLGAEVIKVDAPGSWLLGTGPFSYKGMDTYYMSVSRSKRSMILDLSKEAGRQVFYDLVRVSDVVFDNYRPGVLERLKIDYETLRKVNPRVISCSITGFGSTGPYRDRPAFDLIAQALGGGVAITGHPGGPPVRNGVAVADQGAGMLAVIAILAALHARHRTGEGQRVETSLLEGMIYQMAYEATLYLVSGFVHGPAGSQHVLAVPYGLYPTTDGHIAIAAMGTFENLCRALDRPDLLEDPRFAGRRDRYLNRKELDRELAATFSARTTAEWLERLIAADVPCAPVNSVDKALGDPQVLDRDMVVEVEHVLGGTIKLVGNPIKFEGTPREERLRFGSPPLIGQDSKDILSNLLGYAAQRVEELEQAGVIAVPEPTTT